MGGCCCGRMSFAFVVLFSGSFCRATPVNVSERFGYDPVDATVNLQRALDSGCERIVVDASHGVWNVRPLRGRSGQTIEFEKGAYIRAKRGEFHDRHEPLIKFEYCTNVTIVGAGPDVCGFRMWHEDYTNAAKYAKSEWRHAVSLLSCADVRIEGVCMSESGGDGLYVSTGGRKGSDPGKGPVCRNVVVRNCVMDRNCRQGVSVIGVNGLTMEDCVMSNTFGMPPEAGIDLEPNNPPDSIVGVVLRRCRMIGNRGMGIDILTANHDRTSSPVDMLFEDCETVGNAQAIRYANGTKDSDVPAPEGVIAFRRCVFRASRSRAVTVMRKPLSGGTFELSDCTFDGCGIDEPEKSDFLFSIYGHPGCPADRYLLKNVTICQPCEREPVGFLSCESTYVGEPSCVEGTLEIACAGRTRRVTYDAAWNKRMFPSAPAPAVVSRVAATPAGADVVDLALDKTVPCEPVFIRGRGKFYAFYADRAKTAHLRLVQCVVGRVKTSRGISLYRHGESVPIKAHVCDLPENLEGADVSIPVPAAGFYELGVETGGKGVAIVATDVPVALDVSSGMKSLVGPRKGPVGLKYRKARGRLYFPVLRGGSFACLFAGVANERVSAEIFSPSGESVWSDPAVYGFGCGQVKDAAEGLWSVTVGAPEKGAFEDFLIGLNGVPGWYFLAREKYWKTASKSQPAIILPTEPTAVERSAAAELADGIRRMTGVEPRMVSEGLAGTDGKRFYVGRTLRSREVFGESPVWKDDEVAVRSIEDGLVLDGHPQRGPIYAVDTYLEDACGVRWWTSTESDYPTLRALPVKDVNIRHASPFKYRETYYLDALDPTFKVRLKGNVTSRTKYVKRQPARIAAEQGGDSALHFFPERKSAYHSNLVILPPSAHFATHPEWYSLVDGVRKPVQLCMTNPEMKAEYIRSIRRLLAAHPESDFIQVSQNDGRVVCQCERCQAAEAEDGLSGLYLGFANDVAAAIEKDFPRVTVDTFAYRFTRKPPKRTRPRHNVTVRLCDIECAFNAPLAGSPLNADFLADLEGWREIAAGRLYLWDYTTDFSACMIPHPNLHVLTDNVRLFARSGALGVFAQGDATCRAGFMAPLMAWTMSHLLWKPEADGRRLVDEFLSGYYGSAAPHLRCALSVVEEGGRRAAERGKAVGCYHVNVDAFWTKEEALRFCDSIAAAVAAAENETVRRRVRREELSADLVHLLNWRSWELGSEDERQELLASWEGRCREFGVESYREAFGTDDFDRCVATLKKGLVPDGVNTPKRKP